jgi:hypothetical protein
LGSFELDEAEMLSERFLRSLGFKTVEYEPDGNIPPDFLCDGRVAVEVRRLNHHHVSAGGSPEALDKKGVALWNTVKRTLNDMGPPNSQRSWWVSYSVKRPLHEYNKIPKLLRKALLEFRAEPRTGEHKIKVVEGFTLTIRPAAEIHDLEFVFASASDRDSSGWLLDMMEANIQLCVDEKAQKITTLRGGYPEWWLVLVDMIGWGLSKDDQEMFEDSVSIDKRGWDKVVLIDPRDPSRSFEI